MTTLLTIKEAATRLKVHPQHLYKLVYAQKVPFIRRPGLGVRFDPDQLDAWVREGEEKAKS